MIGAITMTIEEYMMTLTKEKLTKGARTAKMTGYSSLNKAELAHELAEITLSDTYIDDMILGMTDAQLDRALRLADGEQLPLDNNLRHTHDLLRTAYVYIDQTADTLCMCSDIAPLFKKHYNDEINQLRLLYDRVRQYCNAYARLYGIIPLDKAFEIFNKQNDVFNKDEFIDIVTLFTHKSDIHWEIYDDSIVAEDIMMFDLTYDDLKEEQGNKPYYIPSRKKMLKFSDDHYYEDTNELRDLKRFLIREFHMDDDKLQSFIWEILVTIEVDMDFNEIAYTLERCGIAFETRKQAVRCFEILRRVFNTTRLRSNRGFTPSEMSDMYFQPDVSIDGFKSKSTPINAVKVGRNAPCPCGSGKKYKRCCGK